MTEARVIGPRSGRAPREDLPPLLLPQHGLTRYLRVRLGVEDGELRWERPRTLLGIVPLGTRRLAVPLGELSSLRLRRSTPRPVRLTIGVLLIGLPFALVPWWLALPLLLIGVWVTLVALGPGLEIVTSAGRRRNAAVCFGHEFDADLFVEAVHDLIAGEDEPAPIPGDGARR